MTPDKSAGQTDTPYRGVSVSVRADTPGHCPVLSGVCPGSPVQWNRALADANRGCRDCYGPSEMLQSQRKKRLRETSMNSALTTIGLAIGTIALTAGCAHTGVVPIGQDTYMVARQGWISTQSVAELRGQVFGEANEFCASQGKSLQPIAINDTPGLFGRSYPESEVQFRCLSAGDPELGRPTPQRVVTEPSATTVAAPGITAIVSAPAPKQQPPLFYAVPPISTNRPGFNCTTNHIGGTAYTNCW